MIETLLDRIEVKEAGRCRWRDLMLRQRMLSATEPTRAYFLHRSVVLALRLPDHSELCMRLFPEEWEWKPGAEREQEAHDSES